MKFPIGTKVVSKTEVNKGFNHAPIVGEILLGNEDSRQRTVRFEREVAHFDYLDLLVISPEYKGKKGNGKRYGFEKCGITAKYAVFLCQTQFIEVPKRGWIVDVYVDGKVKQLHNISDEFYLYI